MSEFAIQVKHLDKMYKLYNKPSDRLRETLGFKVPVREHYALRDVNFTVERGGICCNHGRVWIGKDDFAEYSGGT